MKVKLLKNLAYGKQGEVVDLSDSAAIYLLRVGAAEAAPEKKKRKAKTTTKSHVRGAGPLLTLNFNKYGKDKIQY